MPDLAALGVAVPRILLPSSQIDLRRWAVVATDQYTSQLDYWQRVEKMVGDRPSTLRLILPEIYLDRDDVDDRVRRIHEAMRAYLSGGVFRDPLDAFVYVERETPHVPLRRGLLAAIDLERYEYTRGATALMRATEGTVEERLPPRVRVRSGAPLELPHIMVLVDDPDCRLIEPLAARVRGAEPLYETVLMEGGGRVRGYAVSDDASVVAIRDALAKLADAERFRNRYAVDDDRVLLFAVGDGNHSLAAAKVHWERVKEGLDSAQRRTHPARFALVELVNVHDDGLAFEPIHRVVFDADPRRLLDGMERHYVEQGSRARIDAVRDAEEQRARLTDLWKADSTHAFGYVAGADRGIISVESPRSNLAVGTLQGYLDREKRTIDYIHGSDVVESLSQEPKRIGFFLPSMKKIDLFRTVIVDGTLPRKTFSMGEPEEKRYYLEARRIVA